MLLNVWWGYAALSRHCVYNLPLTFRSAEEADYVRERMDSKLMAGLAQNKFVGFGIAEVVLPIR